MILTREYLYDVGNKTDINISSLYNTSAAVNSAECTNVHSIMKSSFKKIHKPCISLAGKKFSCDN